MRGGDTTASLYGYLPVSGQNPGQWSGEILGATTTYPNGSAPVPLNTATLPLETGTSGDETVAELATDFPNTSSPAGYTNTYQLRLYTSKPAEGISVKYDSADIEITGSTWSVVYSQAPAIPTTTTLAASPAGSAFHGAKVKLAATVKPSAATGSVQFRDGTKVLKTVAVSAGKASYSTKALSDGTHKLTAKFVPSSNAYGASTSSNHLLTIKVHSTKVTLKASGTSIKVGDALKLAVKETPKTSGKAVFFDGKKKLGSAKVKKGKATFTTTKLKAGKHSLTVKFTPSSKADFSGSTSKAVKVKVT